MAMSLTDYSSHHVTEEKYWTFYFCCVCASLFMLVARPAEIFASLAGVKPGLVCLALAVVAFLTCGGIQSIRSRDIPGATLMKAFLVVGLLSIVFSIWKGHSFETWRRLLLTNTVVYFVWLPTLQTPKRLKQFITVLALSAGFLAVIMVFVPSKVQGAEIGRLRVGYTYDSNDLAMILAVIFPLTSFLFVRSQTKGKLFWCVLLACQVLAILKTGSRGGLLAFGVALCLLLLIKGNGLTLWHRVFVVVLAVAFFMGPAAEKVKERWQLVFTGEDYNLLTPEEGGGGRMALWTNGLRRFAKNPIAGVGIGNSSIAMGQMQSGWLTVHNSYIQVALEIGIVGLIVFLLLLRTIWRSCRLTLRRISPHPELDSLAQLATCNWIALVTFMVAGLFLSQAYSIMVPIMLAVSDGLHEMSRKMDDSIDLADNTLLNVDYTFVDSSTTDLAAVR